MADCDPLRQSLTHQESVDIASAAAVAASYSPLSGLIPPNQRPGVVGVGPGNNVVHATDFSNPDAPNLGPGGTNNPGTISGAGAYTPDWAALISGDAGLKDAAAALAAGGAQNQDALNAQIGNAYTSFGKNIDLAQLAQSLGMTQADLQKALGPDMQKLAQENTDAGLSTTARLDQANQNAIRSITQNLNKRGILNSGEAGYELDQQNLGYRQAQTDSYQKFLGYLQQYQQGYLSAQQANAGKLSDAYSSAADRQYNTHQGSGGVTANFDHTDPSGKPVYKDSSGNLFNLDGSAYSAPAAAPPAPPSQFTGDGWQSQAIHGLQAA